MATPKKKDRKQWSDLPLIARIGIVGGGTYVALKYILPQLGLNPFAYFTADDVAARPIANNPAAISGGLDTVGPKFLENGMNLMRAWVFEYPPHYWGDWLRAWQEMNLTDNDIRWLANYWATNMNNDGWSLYTWISEEDAWNTDELELKTAVLNMLQKANAL